jgi:DNA repair protein RecO
MEKVDGIIINVTPYKNNNVVIGIITKKGLIAMLGRGSLKPNSPTNKYLHQFLYGEFEIYRGPLLRYSLKDCKVYDDFSKYFTNYDDLMIYQFMIELCFKFMVGNPDLYGYYDLLLEVLKEYKASINKYVIPCYFFAQLLRRNGSSLNFDSCVDCGNMTRIVGIDFSKGGVVCKDHATPMTRIINKQQFALYMALFGNNIGKIIEVKLLKIEFLQIIHDLCYLQSKNFDFNLKTVELLETI